MPLSPQESQGGSCKPPTPCLSLIPGDSGVCLKWSSRASGVVGCLTGDPLEPPGQPCTIRLHSCPISAQPGSPWPWDEGPQTRLLLEGLTWWGQLLCLRCSSRLSPHWPPAPGHFLPTPVNWCQFQKEWDCSPGLPGGRAHGPSLGETAGVESRKHPPLTTLKMENSLNVLPKTPSSAGAHSDVRPNKAGIPGEGVGDVRSPFWARKKTKTAQKGNGAGRVGVGVRRGWFWSPFLATNVCPPYFLCGLMTFSQWNTTSPWVPGDFDAKHKESFRKQKLTEIQPGILTVWGG